MSRPAEALPLVPVTELSALETVLGCGDRIVENGRSEFREHPVAVLPPHLIQDLEARAGRLTAGRITRPSHRRATARCGCGRLEEPGSSSIRSISGMTRLPPLGAIPDVAVS
jgi:hypothetical protein